MKRVLHYEEKLTPQSPPLPFFSISSTCSFLFPQTFHSLLLQTRKQSLRICRKCTSSGRVKKPAGNIQVLKSSPAGKRVAAKTAGNEKSTGNSSGNWFIYIKKITYFNAFMNNKNMNYRKKNHRIFYNKPLFHIHTNSRLIHSI